MVFVGEWQQMLFLACPIMKVHVLSSNLHLDTDTDTLRQTAQHTKTQTNIETYRPTNNLEDIQTNKQVGTSTNRQTYKYKDIHTYKLKSRSQLAVV